MTVRAAPASAAASLLEPAMLASLKWRHIGPGLTSGRIADLAVVEDNTDIMYVATATGGAWKTTNHGATWEPVFERGNTASLGAIAVARSNPNVVWVGTGEAWPWRSVSWGDGVYKSEDGGKTWQHMGLSESRHVGRVLIHPENANIVYVAAHGALWGPNEERGLFKTSDGGTTWTKVLHVSPHTGIDQVEMDPRDPDVLYAAAFQRERRNWNFVGGGPEGGLFKSRDGGKTWKKLTNGLPNGDLGRIGISICRSRPDTLYAGIPAQDDQTGLYRSDDGGASWERRGGEMASELRCDANDPERVYLLRNGDNLSLDGGRTVSTSFVNPTVHVDHQTIWIDARNSNHLLLGNDGGVYHSHDRARTWEFMDHIPVTQFYTVAVDMQEPFYFVYGGTQDQNSFGGPSGTRKVDGITNEEWFKTIDGDGFYAQVDPTDSTVVYTEAHYGRLVRYDTRTGEQHLIQPQAREGQQYRWNWSSPVLISAHDHKTLYFAANKVFRSRNRGDDWEVVSSDLTRQLDQYSLPLQGKVWPRDSIALHAGTAEYGSISTLAESPIKRGLLAVGTDDGLIQVTRDDGATWTRIEVVAGVPKQTKVSRVRFSRFQEGTIYATFDAHKNNDLRPYVVKSTDYGQTWNAITGNLPKSGSVHAIVEGLRSPNLLLVGTEFGIFASITGGGTWVSLQNNLPTVPVHDIVVHPRENDVVIGTHGRGFWILDDAAIVEELTPDRLKAESHLARVRPGLQFHRLDHGHRALGQRFFRAANPPDGAIITYYVNPTTIAAGTNAGGKRPEVPPIRLEILDAQGTLVRRLPAKQGSAGTNVQRAVWDLRHPLPYEPDDGDEIPFPYPPYRKLWGPFVLPGEYQVRLVVGDKEQRQKLTVRPDPLAPLREEDRRLWHDTLLALSRMQGSVRAVVMTAEKLEAQFAAIGRALRSHPDAAPTIAGEVASMNSMVAQILEETRAKGDLFGGTMPARVSIGDQVNVLFGYIEGSTARPTSDQQRLTEQSGERLAEQVAILTRLVNERIPALHRQLDEQKVRWTPGRTIVVPSRP